MPLLISAKEAAGELGISTRHLRDLTDAGLLRYILTGKGEKRPRRQYTIEDLKAFIEERARKCRSTSEKEKTPTPTTSSYGVVDFRAILEQRKSERRKPSNAGKGMPRARN